MEFPSFEWLSFNELKKITVGEVAPFLCDHECKAWMPFWIIMRQESHFEGMSTLRMVHLFHEWVWMCLHENECLRNRYTLWFVECLQTRFGDLNNADYWIGRRFAKFVYDRCLLLQDDEMMEIDV
ncbi:small non-structural protein p16 [Broome reovirus]|nr:small non-structural protein p16 [Broome reovirus]ACU68610.1 small non-structural protein p16 [Broome reovirus]